MNYSPPGSSAPGISQARILEWFATSFSRRSFWPGTEPTSPALAGRFFTTEPWGKTWELVFKWSWDSTLFDSETQKEVQWGGLREKINSLLNRGLQRETSLLCRMWTKNLSLNCRPLHYLYLWPLQLWVWRGEPWKGREMERTWKLADIIKLLVVVLRVASYLEFWVREIMNFPQYLGHLVTFCITYSRNHH